MKINTILKLLPVLMFFAAMITCQPAEKVWDVRDFGAVADSATINSEAIQRAIDDCSESGGGTVAIRDGVFLSGTILLKNNVNLHISHDAKLVGSGNPLDYFTIDPFVDATGQSRGKCLIGSLDAENISLTGKGIVDGRGGLYKDGTAKKILEKAGITGEELSKHMGNRPFLIRFVKSTNIKVQNIHLRQPAAWTLHFFQCKDILVDAVTIYSHAHGNNDGIDMDSSQDGIIQNCDIDSGDDAICFKTTSPVPCRNILVNNCRLKSGWGTIKFGTESMGDFQDITVKNCYIHETKGGGIKILSVDGANISNIRIDSIRMENVDMPVFIRLGERLRTYRDAPKQEVGSITDVHISNLEARTWDLENSRISPPTGVFITGTPNHKIGQVYLSNITIQLPGGGSREHGSSLIPEDETRYPEFSFFGVLPASGMYVRHVEELSVEELTISLDSDDERNSTVFIDVEKAPSI